MKLSPPTEMHLDIEWFIISYHSDGDQNTEQKKKRYECLHFGLNFSY